MLWARDASLLPKDRAGVRDPRFVKIAIASPEHAPYGRAAKQALEAAGAWKDVAKRTIYGENVQQTLLWASTGNAEVSIVASRSRRAPAAPTTRSTRPSAPRIPPPRRGARDRAGIVR